MTPQFISRVPRRGWSSVAGIIDQYGGFSVVVSDEWRILRYHVGANDLVFILPNMFVDEESWKKNTRASWHFIPTLIGAVEQYIKQWIETRNDPRIDYRIALYLLRTKQQSLHIEQHPA